MFHSKGIKVCYIVRCSHMHSHPMSFDWFALTKIYCPNIIYIFIDTYVPSFVLDPKTSFWIAASLADAVNPEGTKMILANDLITLVTK